MGLREQLELVLDANISGFVSKMEAAGESAERNMAKADSSMSRLGGRMQVTGAAMVGFGALAIGAMGEAAEAYGKAEEASLKLDNSIAHSTSVKEEDSAAFRDLAEQLQQTTEFSHSATETMEAYLIQTGRTKEQVLQLTPAIADLAAKTGGDLDTAAKKVTLALNGKKKGLEAILGPLDAATYSTDRYAAVTDALGRVQGFATEQGQTFEGQITILKNNLGELEEGVGKGATEAFSEMFSGIQSVTGALNNLNPHSQELIGQVVTFGGVALVGVGALNMLAGTVLKARDNYAGLTEMLGLHSTAEEIDAATTEADTVALGEHAAAELADAAAAEANTVAQGALAGAAGAAGAAMLVALPVAAAVGVLAAIGDSMSHNASATDVYTAAIHKNTGTLQQNIDEATVNELQHNKSAQAAHAAGVSWETLTATVRTGTDDFGANNRILTDQRLGLDNATGTAHKMADALRGAGAGSTEFGRSLIDQLESGKLTVAGARNLNHEMENLHNSFGDAMAKEKDQKQILDALNGSTVNYTAAVKDLHDEMHALMDPLFGAEKALEDNASAQQAVAAATMKHQAAVDAAAAAVKQYGATSQEAQAAQLEVLGTEHDLEQAHMKVASSALSVNDATLQLEGAMRDGNVSISDARDQLNQWVAQGLMTQQSAMEVAAKLGLVVDQTDAIAQQSDLFVKVDADTSGAEAKLENFLNMVRNSSGTVVLGGSSLAMQVKDVGGYVAGAKGQPVPIIAHGGEYVLTVDQTDAMAAAANQAVPNVSFAADAPLPADAPLADQWRHVADVAQSHSRAHDVMHDEGLISDADYLQILQNRLASTERFSDDYDRIWKQIQQITENGLRAQDDVAKQHEQVHDVMHAAGDLSDDAYLQMLQQRLAGTEKYSQEWERLSNQIESIQDNVAKSHMEQHDVMHDVGDLSDDAYLQMLQQRLAKTEQYSSDWERIYNEIQDIKAKQLKTQQQQVADQAALEDREYAHGLMSLDDYRSLLEQRLEAATQFSDEYFTIEDKIAALDKAVADAQKAAEQHDLELLRNKVTLGIAGKDELVAALRQAESGLEEYSDAWMSLHNEIDKLNPPAPAAPASTIMGVPPGGKNVIVEQLHVNAPMDAQEVQRQIQEILEVLV